MITIPGCHLTDTLYESERSLVLRGYDKEDQNHRPLVFKTLKTEYPTPEEIARFRTEYEICKNVNMDGVAKSYRFQRHKHSLIFSMEDIGGTSLDRYISDGPFELAESLKLAIAMSTVLGHIHQYPIIHKDINPSNIVYNATTGQINIIDFGLSTVLSRENASISNADVVEGSLAYISPEQSGRMNREIDYRTDYYSLGVTLYELVTGRLPFESSDAMELIHAHMAKQPVPPHQIKPEIPEAVSNIILKLLAKTAEARYQSAHGIRTDLETCYDQWRADGVIETFVCGLKDTSDSFHIPQRLYGRDEEVGRLLNAFEQVDKGLPFMLMVSGYTGIGKSALVAEVQKPLVMKRGYFISGKYDQLQRNVPYSGYIQAFRDLIRQMLTESEMQIARWKDDLMKAMEPNGQVIVDVIPELELIIGDQPPIPELGPTLTHNRFNLVFQQFMRVFVQDGQPLVVFLDDLQWADSASLQLTGVLSTDPKNKHILLIGAYRDNEVNAGHPLQLTLDEIENAGVTVENIALRPLAMEHVNQLIADTFNCASGESTQLAELVFRKTGGNPFFIDQFLRSLYEESLVRFDAHRGRWQWDESRIQDRDITDNVVELMSGKIQKLSTRAQKMVQLASCVGNTFDLRTLAIVNGKSLVETAEDMWSAVEEGLVLPIGDSYKYLHDYGTGTQSDGEFKEDFHTDEMKDLHVSYRFLHDRVQQAAYAIIPESQKQEIHYQIGHLLLKGTSEEDQHTRIFEIVDHLNFGSGLITELPESIRLGKLNLMAGKHAKSSSAFQTAYTYFTNGIALLEEDAWEKQYDLTQALYLEAVESAYLISDFTQMEHLAEPMMKHAQTILDKVKIYEIRILAAIAQNMMAEAVEIAREVLGLLDIPLPLTPEDSDIIEAYSNTQAMLAGKSIEEFSDLPAMTDPDKLAAMHILVTATNPVYFSNPKMFPLLVFHMVDLSIEYGNSTNSAFGFGVFGIILCGAFGQIEEGYQFGLLGQNLQEGLKARELTARVSMNMNVGTIHWKEHLRGSLDPLLQGYKTGLELGDLEFGLFCAVSYCNNLFYTGRELLFVEQELVKFEEVAHRLKHYHHEQNNTLFRQVVLNLVGRSDDPCRLQGEACDETEVITSATEAKNRTRLHQVYANKTLLSYLFHDYSSALQNARLAENEADAVMGSYHQPQHNLFYSLALLAMYPELPDLAQKEAMEKVSVNQEFMKNWAEHAPMNYRHKFDLVEAERARVLDHAEDARASYARAIDHARSEEFLMEEAIACECAARYHLELGMKDAATKYIKDARHAFLRWNASAKVNDIDERYAALLAPAPVEDSSKEIPARIVGRSTRISNSDALDFTTVYKATQAISGEIVLSDLFKKLILILIENAGAQRGVLILESDGSLMIEAEGTVDQQSTDKLAMPVDSYPDISHGIVNYVNRTRETVVLSDAVNDGLFTNDPYVVSSQSKSMLCMPILQHSSFMGMIYLENNLSIHVFTSERLQVLEILAGQTAISLENARFYDQLAEYNANLELKVTERTRELEEKNTALANTLQELRATQNQLVQSEKMAALGSVTAGIAHEIKNPLNFVNNFSELSVEMLEELQELIDGHREKNEIENYEDWTEVMQVLVMNIEKINEHGKRADSIVRNMLLHSRGKTGERHFTDINALLDEDIRLAYHGMRGQDSTFNMSIETDYDASITEIEVVPQDLSRVFLNLISNACYAVQKKKRELGDSFSPSLEVWTKNLGDKVELRIRDNGPGVPEDVRDQIFEPF
ncbi:MAG: AAA family ATPase, partial [Candidatus Latescibacteria bacterium]|nr:AAA family ATPase [Candidatus Latescibacterota bacterium]